MDGSFTLILCHTQEVTDRINLVHLNKHTEEHPMALREDIVSIQYNLLSIELRQSNTGDDMVTELLRLGLLLYLSSILNETPPGTSFCDILCAKVATVLNNIRMNHGMVSDFQLWIAFIGVSLVDNTDTKSQLIKTAVDTIRALRLSTWENLEMIFRSFFWVEKIHRSSFRRIWEALLL